jgi:hypothetical protein
MTNSRMKDFFDIRALAREGVIGVTQLGDAIAATFQRRGTPLPEAEPFGLSDEFASDTTKLAQWKAFLGKNRLNDISLGTVVKEIRQFIETPLAHARRKQERR